MSQALHNFFGCATWNVTCVAVKCLQRVPDYLKIATGNCPEALPTTNQVRTRPPPAKAESSQVIGHACDVPCHRSHSRSLIIHTPDFCHQDRPAAARPATMEIRKHGRQTFPTSESVASAQAPQ
ncbi:hypothetical protein BDR07DRAFT_265455 [Suillus spraguei]|nr:hypothetical protein BDR07DRAFT_265455 [Suillus spraguei]